MMPLEHKNLHHFTNTDSARSSYTPLVGHLPKEREVHHVKVIVVFTILLFPEIELDYLTQGFDKLMKGQRLFLFIEVCKV